jgi:tetratricopeptide (TPR) repeat protein
MNIHMRPVAALLIIAMLFAPCLVSAQDAKTEGANQLFYTGNHFYQKQDYIKAVEEYLKLLDMGIESGNLYYNIGNGFLKLGKVGYAILCYRKARRLIPHDSDLKANLTYARSLMDEESSEEWHRNIFIRAVRKMCSDLNLGQIAGFALGTYLLLILVLALFIFNPILGRKFWFFAILLGLAFAFNALAFGVRYYGEVILKHGVVVQAKAEAKYEPIDKSTTFYNLREGNSVIILNTKQGWRQIRRFDGKTGWVKKEAIEEI